MASSKDLHKFLEDYLSKEIDLANIEKFIKIWYNGSTKEKEILELCVSIFSPFELPGLLSLSKSYTQHSTEKKIPKKEELLEKEINKLNNRIRVLTEVCDELRESYINLYRSTNKIN